MNVFIKEQVLDKSYLEYLVIRKSFEEKCSQYIMNAFNKCLSIHLLEYSRIFDKCNSLIKVEGLASFFEELKEAYRDCMHMFEDEQFVSNHPQKDIIFGIKEMLKNQIEQLEFDFKSRIEIERMAIKSNAIHHIKANFKKILNENLEANFSLMITNSLIYDIVEEYTKTIFEEAMDEIKAVEESSIAFLTDITKRPELLKCYGLFSQQMATLDVLFNMENEIIEEVLADEENKKLWETFDLLIQSIHKQFREKLEEIEEQIKNKAEYIVDKEREYNNISNIIKTLKENQSFNQKIETAVECYLVEKERILKSLYVSTVDEINKAINFSMKEVNNDSKETQLLSFQILETLRRLLDKITFIEKMKESDEAISILKGIKETIGLKFESLKGRNTEYIIEKKEKLVLYEKKLIDFLETLTNEFEMYFDDLIAGSKEDFLKAHKKYVKLENQIKADNAKHDFNYLKQDLLFEVVTFEEIIKYSMPKIMACPNEEVKKAAEMIMEEYHHIEKTIQRSGIRLINPEAHERFNGIEHEVLVAEETNEFQKGEIMQLYTKGYKYFDKVIIRASVTVAK
jgi:molecular chaperone GrpE (heat shock protein)